MRPGSVIITPWINQEGLLCEGLGWPSLLWCLSSTLCPAQDVRTISLTLNLRLLHGKTVSGCDVTGQTKVTFLTCFLDYRYQHLSNMLDCSFLDKAFFLPPSLINKTIFVFKRNCAKIKHLMFTAGRQRGLKIKGLSWAFWEEGFGFSCEDAECCIISGLQLILCCRDSGQGPGCSERDWGGNRCCLKECQLRTVGLNF